MRVPAPGEHGCDCPGRPRSSPSSARYFHERGAGRAPRPRTVTAGSVDYRKGLSSSSTSTPRRTSACSSSASGVEIDRGADGDVTALAAAGACVDRSTESLASRAIAPWRKPMHSCAGGSRTTHPELATWTDIGDSWQKTAGIGGLRPDGAQAERTTPCPVRSPSSSSMSAIHAREYATAELMTALRRAPDLELRNGSRTRHLAARRSRGSTSCCRSNPDGRKQAESGQLWRKNTNKNYCGPNSSSRGADLNPQLSLRVELLRRIERQPMRRDLSRRVRRLGAGDTGHSRLRPQHLSRIQRPDPVTEPAPARHERASSSTCTASVSSCCGRGASLAPTRRTATRDADARPEVRLVQRLPPGAVLRPLRDGRNDGRLHLTATSASRLTPSRSAPISSRIAAPSRARSCPTTSGADLRREGRARTYISPPARMPIDLGLSGKHRGARATASRSARTLDDTRYNNSNGTEPTQNVVAGGVLRRRSAVVHGAHARSRSRCARGWQRSTVASSRRRPVATADDSRRDGTRSTSRGQDAAGVQGLVSASFSTVVDPATAPRVTGSVTAAGSGSPLAATVRANAQFNTQTAPDGSYTLLLIPGTYDATATPANDDYAPQTVTGIHADGHDTIAQNFLLYPYCDLLTGDVESGKHRLDGADAMWAITTEASFSPTHSWTRQSGRELQQQSQRQPDSPATLRFHRLHGRAAAASAQICDTEAGFDFCKVEIAPDGVTWQTVASFRWRLVGVGAGRHRRAAARGREQRPHPLSPDLGSGRHGGRLACRRHPGARRRAPPASAPTPIPDGISDAFDNCTLVANPRSARHQRRRLRQSPADADLNNDRRHQLHRPRRAEGGVLHERRCRRRLSAATVE